MNILFVEDDAMNRRVVSDMLAVAGIAMHEAARAEDGLRLLDEHGFDMVLMDLRMPGMDGLEAIRRIRSRHDAVGRLPIVVVTADMSPNLRQQCLSTGADDVLFKPVAMDDLFDSLGRLFAARDGALPI